MAVWLFVLKRFTYNVKKYFDCLYSMPYCHSCSIYIQPRKDQKRQVVTSISKRGSVRTSNKSLCNNCAELLDIKEEYRNDKAVFFILLFFIIVASFFCFWLAFLTLAVLPMWPSIQNAHKKKMEAREARLQKEDTPSVSAMQFEIDRIDLMTGIEFEGFCGDILKCMGYLVSYTPATGDRGIDIIAEKDGRKLGVQTKRYVKKVGISAVQEVVAGKLYHKVDDMLVITNSYFTPHAVELAQINKVILWDKAHLRNLLVEIA